MKNSIIIITLFGLSIGVSAQQSGDTYNFISAVANKALDVQWGNNENGTPLHLWPQNGGDAQLFTLEDAGGGYFFIKSALGKYVHVYGGKGIPKAKVTLWEKVNQDNLKWRFVEASNGYFYIKSKLGTFLDVQGGKSDNGTPIWMWTLNGGAAQKWRLKKLPKEPSFNEILKNTPEMYTQRVNVSTIKGLCPHALVGGDLEFGGNGPKVFGYINLRRSEDSKTLIAQIKFNARETKSDWLTGHSEVQGYWEVPIYKAPFGVYINGIEDFDNSISKFDKVLEGGGANELFGGGKDGSPHILTSTDGLDGKGFVSTMEIVGDTGGWDISTDDNCENDTRILKVVFNPIKVELIRDVKQ